MKVAPKFSSLILQGGSLAMKQLGRFLDSSAGKLIWRNRFQHVLPPLLTSLKVPTPFQKALCDDPGKLVTSLGESMVTRSDHIDEIHASSFLEMETEWKTDWRAGFDSGVRSVQKHIWTFKTTWSTMVIMIILTAFWLFVMATQIYTNVFSDNMRREGVRLRRICERHLDPELRDGGRLCTSSRLFLSVILTLFMLSFVSVLIMSMIRLYVGIKRAFGGANPDWADALDIHSPRPDAHKAAMQQKSDQDGDEIELLQLGEDTELPTPENLSQLEEVPTSPSDVDIASGIRTGRQPLPHELQFAASQQDRAFNGVSDEPASTVPEMDSLEDGIQRIGYELMFNDVAKVDLKRRHMPVVPGRVQGMFDVIIFLVLAVTSVIMLISTIGWFAAIFFLIPKRFEYVTEQYWSWETIA